METKINFYKMLNGLQLEVRLLEEENLKGCDIQIFCEEHLIAVMRNIDFLQYIEQMKVINAEDFVLTPKSVSIEILTGKLSRYLGKKTRLYWFGHPNEGQINHIKKCPSDPKMCYIGEESTGITAWYEIPKPTKLVKEGEKIKTDVGIYTIKKFGTEYILVNDQNQFSNGNEWFQL